MSDDLTDDEIALLCDIGECDLSKLTADKREQLQRLVSGGYIEQITDSPISPFKLTPKGVAFLGERGAGLNEA
jgi:hypothetical protein